MQDTGDIIQATLGEPQIGGDGDDLLIGDDRANVLEGGNGVDTLVGLGGDDTIVGNKGDDRMLGGAGDDLLVWNNGDGSDIMTGDAGDDRTQVNFNTDLVEDDLQNDDTARIETNGARTEFARTEVNGQTERGLFALNIDGVETLEVNFGGGNDTAELVGELSREVDIELDGGEGADELDLSELSSGVRVVLDASGGDDQNGFVVTGPVRVDARDFENVVGTDFDDKVRGSKEDNVISGGDGADTLRGLRGDDTIVGNKGDDRMIGGAGDDLLVWNNGDGSDLMKGGRGDDRTQVNFDTDLVNDDLQNDDTARIESAGQNFRFARTEVNGQSERGLFELDIRFVETLEVNFGGGDDTAELVGVPSRRLTTELDGGEGEDTLDLSDVERAAVVDIGAGLASVERGGDVVFEGFENVIGTDFAD
ncbi:MAG: calcium-binding protein, partial [Pseudomonadota bacterium]